VDNEHDVVVWVLKMAIRHSQSLELRLRMEGKLPSCVERELYPRLQQIHDRVAPTLWPEDENYITGGGVLDDEEQAIRRTQIESHRRNDEYKWISHHLKTLAQDPEIARAAVDAAARRGDRDVPLAMQPAAKPTEMMQIYRSQFPDSAWHDPNAAPPEPFSRLKLRDPNTPEPGPPSRFGEARNLTPCRQMPRNTPAADPLSLSALSKRVLAPEYHLHEKRDIPSKTIALPARRAW
jgi:hypothetical protein